METGPAMDTNLLHEFVTLAEYLNFSTAAKMMNMSQSTLSRHIGDLERHYGTLLFSRRDSLTLTYAGQILLEECAGLFAIEDRIEERIRASKRQYQGTIYVEDYQFSHEVRSFLLRAINTFRAENPAVFFEFRRVRHNVGILDSVKEEYFDVGVLVKSSERIETAPNIEGFSTIALPALTSRLAVYTHEDTIDANGGSLPLASFAEIPFLLPLRPEYASFRNDFTVLCEQRGFTPQFLLKEMHSYEQLALFDMHCCAQIVRFGDVQAPSSPFLLDPHCCVIELEEELYATPYLIFRAETTELVKQFEAHVSNMATAHDGLRA